MEIPNDKVAAVVEAVKEGDSAAALVILEEALVESAGGEGDTPGEPDADPLTSAADQSGDEPEDEPEDERAAMRALKRTAGVKSAGEVVRAFGRMRGELDSLLADKQRLEDSSRRELVAELVKLGFETPATAWSKDPKDPKRLVPCKRLASEPLDEMRERVEQLRRHSRVAPLRASSSEAETRELSVKDLELCRKRGIDPQEFAARKASCVRRVGGSK